MNGSLFPIESYQVDVQHVRFTEEQTPKEEGREFVGVFTKERGNKEERGHVKTSCGDTDTKMYKRKRIFLNISNVHSKKKRKKKEKNKRGNKKKKQKEKEKLIISINRNIL